MQLCLGFFLFFNVASATTTDEPGADRLQQNADNAKYDYLSAKRELWPSDNPEDKPNAYMLRYVTSIEEIVMVECRSPVTHTVNGWFDNAEGNTLVLAGEEYVRASDTECRKAVRKIFHYSQCDVEADGDYLLCDGDGPNTTHFRLLGDRAQGCRTADWIADFYFYGQSVIKRLVDASICTNKNKRMTIQNSSQTHSMRHLASTTEIGDCGVAT